MDAGQVALRRYEKEAVLAHMVHFPPSGISKQSDRHALTYVDGTVLMK